MISSNTQKTTLHALNSHLITALLSLFITGILLIFIGLFFGVELLGFSSNADLFKSLVIAIICFGLILIALGVLQSLVIIKKTKKVIDIILKKGDLGTGNTQYQTKPAGIGGGLKILRPTISTSEAKPIVREPSVTKTTPINKNIAPNPSKIASDENSEEKSVDISLEEGLQMIVERYNDPSVSKKFSNWDETLMMNFKDLNKSYLFKIHMDQGIELLEGMDEEAAVQVNLDSTIFLKMMTKQINPIKAYSSGGLEVKGKMRNLLKLRKLMF